MPRFFACVRGINAGQGRGVRMEVVRQAFECLGFWGVTTLLASGNVAFETRAAKVEALDQKSKAELMALGTDTDGFRVHGREIYWWRRKKPGTSEFSTVPLTTALHRPFTIRSTNTIRRLAARLDR